MEQEAGTPASGRAMAALALVAGLVVGWLAGRQSVDVPPPPPPAEWINPLADTEEGERLVLRYADGTVDEYIVTEAGDDSVLVQVTKRRAAGSASSRQLRFSRNFPGVLIVLEGDLAETAIDAGLRNFVVHRMVRETITVGTRSHDAWRIEGRHRQQGMLKIWVDPTMPVHGVIRVEGERGVVFEVAE